MEVSRLQLEIRQVSLGDDAGSLGRCLRFLMEITQAPRGDYTGSLGR